MLAYNSEKQPSMGHSPFYLSNGFEPNQDLEFRNTSQHPRLRCTKSSKNHSQSSKRHTTNPNKNTKRKILTGLIEKYSTTTQF